MSFYDSEAKIYDFSNEFNYLITSLYSDLANLLYFLLRKKETVLVYNQIVNDVRINNASMFSLIVCFM